MDAVCNQEGLGLRHTVHYDRSSARGRSHNDESVPVFQSLRFKFSRIKKCEFIVTCSLDIFRGSIGGMVHDGKLFRDNHDAFAVPGSLYDPASQRDGKACIGLPCRIRGKRVSPRLKMKGRRDLFPSLLVEMVCWQRIQTALPTLS